MGKHITIGGWCVSSAKVNEKIEKIGVWDRRHRLRGGLPLPGVCVCVCIYMHIGLTRYIHIFIFIYTHTCMYVCVCILNLHLLLRGLPLSAPPPISQGRLCYPLSPSLCMSLPYTPPRILQGRPCYPLWLPPSACPEATPHSPPPISQGRP